MAKQPPFALIYDPAVAGQLDAIESKFHSLIRATIEKQLQFRPESVTRNRKPLLRPVEMGARWELRFGPQNRFRVFYRVESEQRTVYILAIGVKDRERLIISGEEVTL
jgi:mRNA-degrading endonuclease RelE of RelBE toxin-antitoxin system